MSFIYHFLENLKKRKVYSYFKDNVWGVDLADMQLISKYNKGVRYLLCAIDLFSKYDFVVLLSSIKWSVLAHPKSQPRGQNFQAQI